MSHTNRLAKETSPYLLQHAHNPVDWYPWGPEAFEAARTQDKPIFLSVGYSTCYWCHVMERQSFESEAIAAEMNSRFINIKVDREERPDVDQLYMMAVQVLTQHGGWPMSVFLLPDLRPFYGGTYFPPMDMSGRPGFVTILRAIEDAYKNRRADVEKSATQLQEILSQIARPAVARQAMTIDRKQIDDLIRRSTSDYDSTNGGFGTAPKFPRETLLELLLCSDSSEIQNPKSAIRNSLNAMANGGIRDHLGGGFHRYSTDAHWLVPHFEIMLYDNAMLGWCYVEAHRQTGEPRYASIARGIFDFVLREMTSPAGAFYTALDAEVDAQEGEPYVWTQDRIEEVLGQEKGDTTLYLKTYGVDQGPNFADPHGGNGVPDKNVLYLPDGPAMEDDPRIVSARQKLYEARRQRKQPLLDTKVITSWNGLMIRALAHGAKVLDEPRYLDGASSAATFLLRNHLADDGTLYRTSRDGVRKYHGFLDDYAFLIHGLLALHEAGGVQAWRDRAEGLARTMVEKFADPQGGFYFSDAGATDLIVRQMVASDSPLPSGNGVAARVMMELGEVEIARKTIARFGQQLVSQGEGMSALVLAAGEYVQRHGPIEVAAGDLHATRPPSPQDLAGSVVRLRAHWRGPRELEIQVSILAPYHINGHAPAAGMIGTDLHLDEREVERIEYPAGETYAGDVAIIVRYKSDVTQKQRMAIKYQACDESACLPEVMKQFEIGLPT